MILHIGANRVVFTRDIVAIIDSACIDAASINREMLASVESEGCLLGPAEDTASYVFVVEDGTTRIYRSPISSATLAHRCNALDDLVTSGHCLHFA